LTTWEDRLDWQGQDHRFSGARSLETALAERAFHALRQLEGSPLPLGARIQRQQTAFAVTIAAERCLVLQQHLSAEALAAITDPSLAAFTAQFTKEQLLDHESLPGGPQTGVLQSRTSADQLLTPSIRSSIS
jgi:hypothetical protein